MARFEFSSTPENPLYGATFTIAQLRRQYAENGGKLSKRNRRKLGYFAAPFLSSGSGTSRKFAITGTKYDLVDSLPPRLVEALAPHFERANAAWFEANPWIGDPDHEIPQSLIDQEFGLILTPDEKWSDEDE